MIIFHIGSWKTGTTSLQSTLRKNSEKLGQQSVHFLDQQSDFFRTKFVRKFRNDLAALKRGQSQDSAEVLESIDCLINLKQDVGAKVLVVSWEPLLGHPFPGMGQFYTPRPSGAWLNMLAAQVDLKVTLTIRELKSFVDAMYAQEVRKG